LPCPQELVIVVVGLSAFFAFPGDLGLLTRIAVTAMFVLSLSLVIGQAGIPTLGQAAFFGAGAYAEGLFALNISSDPLLGVLAGGGIGALLAFASGLIVLRAQGLTLLMMTVAFSQILLQIVNKASGLTGGDNGLSGYTTAPILGLYRFDFYGRTGFLYALAILTICYFLLRMLIRSPFGLTCRGLQADRRRMTAVGCQVQPALLLAYTIGGLVAGIAGAVSAQTAEVVSVASLGFFLSAEALVMLVLGGRKRLAGALVGTSAFMLIHHISADINPSHWLFAIGILLTMTVLIFPGGLIELTDIRAQIKRLRGQKP
jgi:branched-chain amino acid transport system permease protein